MSSLLPVYAAGQLVRGITEYLTTSFALADRGTSEALGAFLSDRENGMFYGPYVKARMPYAPAEDEPDELLEWLPDWFRPYHHQAEAFKRLRSKVPGGKEHEPEPTLVVTGTGSGKTESFLYPILDHARRERRLGKRGVKALILYPMNALANDQASRLADLLTDFSEELGGVTAGIYTGETSGSGATRVSKDSLITDRNQIRSSPPDILLTNYKMLDQLLLRPADREIWRVSAHSLRYLVLDEFHTYDGAQGTDVALLLRRLGMVLRRFQDSSLLTRRQQRDPLGLITPVATSATLGGGEDVDDMLEFAFQVFGRELAPEAIVGEASMSIPDWRAEVLRRFGPSTDDTDDDARVPRPEDYPGGGADPEADEIFERVAAVSKGSNYIDAVREVLGGEVFGFGPADSLSEQIVKVAAHPLTERFLAAAATPRPLTTREGEDVVGLAEELFGPKDAGEQENAYQELTTYLVSLFADLRARLGEEAGGFEGKILPGLEAHLWVREVSRIDRLAGEQRFRWSDDGPADAAADEAWLPACYCRQCGRSGWMAALEPNTPDDVILDPQKIRAMSMNNTQRGNLRPLLEAAPGRPGEDEANDPRDTADAPGRLYWLDTATKTLSASPLGSGEDDALAPVLSYADVGDGIAKAADKQTCPSCGNEDSIRFIGSGVATLLSVSLSNLFGLDVLDAKEKKTLVFTDSVQDAAHRAAFVQARSRSFSLRTQTRRAVAEAGGTARLDELARLLLKTADRAATTEADKLRSRFELLPPELARSPRFQPLWNPEAGATERQRARDAALERLAFDEAREFGDRSDLPRSLGLTGSVTAQVVVDDDEALEAARNALEEVTAPLEGWRDGDVVRWARGVLEFLRMRGAIDHKWLRPYLADDGNVFLLNRRQARDRGVPRMRFETAPEFPRLGRTLHRPSPLTPVNSAQGFYATWSRRALGLPRDEASRAVTKLLAAMAKAGWLHKVTTETHAIVYALAPGLVEVSTEGAGELVACPVCNARRAVGTQARAHLEGAPCFTKGCPGRLTAKPVEENYYQGLYATERPRTVVSREHTSLLEREARQDLERQFRGSEGESAPDAPNVLVATPTLEMGIDIGDLSAVMLASLPDTVASYVQRVGRAGRLSGNSLIVALVRGRGKALPKLNQPLSVIDGRVNPPWAMLEAAAILKRQFLASVIDYVDVEAELPELNNADHALNASLRGLHTVLVELLSDEKFARARVEEFLRAIGERAVSEEATDELRDWATAKDSDCAVRDVERAAERFTADERRLGERLVQASTVLEELEGKVVDETGRQRLSAGEDEYEQYRDLKTMRKSLNRQLIEHSRRHWVSAMEDYGLLPNFTLLDEAVDLELTVSEWDSVELEWAPMRRSYSRGVSAALQELAPGATFYVDGVAATIDAVEMDHDGGDVEQWRVCPACSYVRNDTTEPGDPGPCPRCGSEAFADQSQQVDVLPMRQVSASVERTRAAIGDQTDDRSQASFHLATTLAADEEDLDSGWFTSSGFGATYLPRATLRWLNLGRGEGEGLAIAGRAPQAPLFRVCRVCGQVDSRAGGNDPRDHRAWCPRRTEREEDTVSFALGRTLTTQAVLLQLPPAIATGADTISLPSLIAAIKLGFRERFGGDPDNLDVVTLPIGAPGSSRPQDALVIHDQVPGGTGYLSQFHEPKQVFELLKSAWQVVHECDCQHSDREACPNCLLPYAPYRQIDKTSRAAADVALTKILTDDLRLKEGRSPADLGPDFWEITHERPTIDEDSLLEHRFSEVFRAWLESRHADIVERHTSEGRRELTFRFNKGKDEELKSESWTFEEQKKLLHARTIADFYLENSTGTRRIAVYLDGFAYHGAAVNHRAGHDADARSLLAAEGIVPWTITWRDLDEYEEYQRTGVLPTTPLWHAGGKADRGLAQRLGLNAHDEVALLTRGPVAQLFALVERPGAKFWGLAGRCATAHAVLNAIGSGSAAEKGATPVGSLIEIARTGTVPSELRLGYSDDPETYREAWGQFWALANLLAIGEDPVSFTAAYPGAAAAPAPARAQAAPAAEPTPEPVSEAVLTAAAAPGATSGEPDSAGEWAETLEEFADEDSAVVESLRTLAASGGVPEDFERGPEVAGLPTVLAWPQRRVALLFTEDEYEPGEPNAALEGWRWAFAGDVSPLVEALTD